MKAVGIVKLLQTGTVYLIHFDEPLHHARHYIGYACNVEGRLYYHKKGTGAKLLAACNRKGITYRIVREWKGDRTLERKLKSYKKAPLLCPICRELTLLKKHLPF